MDREGYWWTRHMCYTERVEWTGRDINWWTRPNTLCAGTILVHTSVIPSLSGKSKLHYTLGHHHLKTSNSVGSI